MKNGIDYLMLAAISGALAVGLGAIGAHAFAPLLEAYGRTETYGTAVDYHFYHTLGLFIIAILRFHFKNRLFSRAAFLMLAGMVLFSGSLYALSLSDLSFFAYVTPFGGVLLLLAWLVLAYGLLKMSKTNHG